MTSQDETIKIQSYKHLTFSKYYMSPRLRIAADPYDNNNIAFIHDTIITSNDNSFSIKCSASDVPIVDSMQICEQLLALTTKEYIVFVDCSTQQILHKFAHANGYNLSTILTKECLICASGQICLDNTFKVDIYVIDIKSYSIISSYNTIIKDASVLYRFMLITQDDNYTVELITLHNAPNISYSILRAIHINIKDKSIVKFPKLKLEHIEKVSVHFIVYTPSKIAILTTINDYYVAIFELDRDGIITTRKTYRLDPGMYKYNPTFNCFIGVSDTYNENDIYYVDMSPYFNASGKTIGLHTKSVVAQSSTLETASSLKTASSI